MGTRPSTLVELEVMTFRNQKVPHVHLRLEGALIQYLPTPGYHMWYFYEKHVRDVSVTVRLLTHVLCKPPLFFFQLFIATMSDSLQSNFSSVMKDWAD